MLESVHRLILTPALVSSEVSKALPNIIRSSVLDGMFTIKRMIILRSQVHSETKNFWLCYFCNRRMY